MFPFNKAPEVGDDVFYVAPGSADGTFPKAKRAAKIAETYLEVVTGALHPVTLFVMNPQGIHFPTAVAHDRTGETPFTWHYPGEPEFHAALTSGASVGEPTAAPTPGRIVLVKCPKSSPLASQDHNLIDVPALVNAIEGDEVACVLFHPTFIEPTVQWHGIAHDPTGTKYATWRWPDRV